MSLAPRAPRSRSVRLFSPLVALTLLVPLSAAPPAAGSTTAYETTSPALTVTTPTVDRRADPTGLLPTEPVQFSWQLEADRRGVEQRAYQVRVWAGDTASGRAMWDSGRVRSDRSVDVPYDGPDLTAESGYTWSVRAWDDDDNASRWTTPAHFETALADAAAWTGQWIGKDTSQVGSEWTDYTVTVTASHIEGALGIYVRGSDRANAYMWQLSESGHALRPHVKVNNGYTVLDAAPFSADLDLADRHEYTLEVAGDTLTTRVDGDVVDTRADATHTAPGLVGLRTSGGESALVHDISVTTPDGDSLLDATFPGDEHELSDGRATADGLAVSEGDEAWAEQSTDVQLLRTEFDLPDVPVTSARVYATARGLYELELDGNEVGDHQLAPGWTDYADRIQYQTYDVTDLLHPGTNVLGAQLAKGWFAGRIAQAGSERYGTTPSLLAQLRVELADGTTRTITTGEDWSVGDSPIRTSDLLDGEGFDARAAHDTDGWSSPGFDATGWVPADVIEAPEAELVPQQDQPVRVLEELSATALPSPAEGVHLYDLGQNMVGHVRARLTGAPGTTATLRFGEVLNPDGTLYTDNLRTAKVTDTYTFDESGTGVFEPTFTSHGFRFVEITGVAEAPAAGDVVGVVVGTDTEESSELSTGSAMVDQLDSNIRWGRRGNFLSVPTDTPARDERLGWTGDINVFGETAAYTADSREFLRKWLRDLRDSQRTDGAFPGFAPVIPGHSDGGMGTAGWGDAGVHVPWTLWRAYGDTDVVEENYAAMRRYVDYLHADSENWIRDEGGYLDWVNLDDPTEAGVVSTAFMAKSTQELAEMARAIGRTADADAYDAAFAEIRAAYQREFVAADGTVTSDSQTSYVLTITHGLVPDELEDEVAAKFLASLERRDRHLSVGFLGVEGLLPALSQIGRDDVAFEMLQHEDYPSWGYEIANGATTVWERWNSILPDGSFHDPGMNSFNHYAYGAVGRWMYGTMAGVRSLEPGYRRSLVAPRIDERVGHVDYRLDTPYGAVESGWDVEGDHLELTVTVPANTTAEIRVPAASRHAVLESGTPAARVRGIEFERMVDGAAAFSVGSGTYRFLVDEALGDLGDARDGLTELADAVDDARDDGHLTRSQAAHLGRLADGADRETSLAWSAYLRSDDDAPAHVHAALADVGELRTAVEDARRNGAPEDVAEALLAAADAVAATLADASAALLGAQATLVVGDEAALPGSTVPVELRLANTGRQTLLLPEAELALPDGWTATSVGQLPDRVEPGTTAVRHLDVSLPAGRTAGSTELAGTVSYTYGDSTAELRVTGGLDVLPGVVVGAAGTTPNTAGPSDSVTVHATIENRSAVEQPRTVTVTVPEGWPAPEPESLTLAPGAVVEHEVEIRVPGSVTGGTTPVGVAVGTHDDESAQATLDVLVPTPPTGVVDHADVGDAASEAAHGLTASPGSGTNVEAGLTRRYTGVTAGDGHFELDLDVPAGEAFVLTVVETYDGPQRKTYDVLADGVRVLSRDHRKTDDGAGAVTYRLEVDPSAATADGTMRLRFADTPGDYDPSIADVWTSTPGA